MKHLTLRRSRSRGFSMIEALVSIVLLSVGLIGLVGLQARAIQVSVGAEDSSRAALLANELVSSMWAARTVSLSSTVITAWQSRVADPMVAGLPNGVGSVSVASNVATITVTWRATSATSDNRYITHVMVQ
jgi:type IV pilus assembly protein PilV